MKCRLRSVTEEYRRLVSQHGEVWDIIQDPRHGRNKGKVLIQSDKGYQIWVKSRYIDRVVANGVTTRYVVAGW